MINRLVPTSKLKVYDVINANGDDMGQVQNFMIDMVTGRVALVVVSFGGVLGISDKWIAIPFEWMPSPARWIASHPAPKWRYRWRWERLFLRSGRAANRPSGGWSDQPEKPGTPGIANMGASREIPILLSARFRGMIRMC